MNIYFPRIDHGRNVAVCVQRFPGRTVCARISVRPLKIRIPKQILSAVENVFNPKGGIS